MSHPLTGSECDEEDVDFEESDSDESWTTESAISSESILSSMCMNGGDEKPFACPVPGCKKRYKVGFTPLKWFHHTHGAPGGPKSDFGTVESLEHVMFGSYSVATGLCFVWFCFID